MNYTDVRKMLAFNAMELDVESKVIKSIEEWLYEDNLVYCVKVKAMMSDIYFAYIAAKDKFLRDIKEGDVLLIERDNETGFILLKAEKDAYAITKEHHVTKQTPVFRVLENITRKYGTN